MILNSYVAEKELEKAGKSNPGPWTNHSKYVALAAKNIASKCKELDEDKAYICGLMHDIGRYVGVTSEKHLIDGYKYCMKNGWEDVAKICITHAFMLQDVNSSIGKFDMSKEKFEFMKEFIETVEYDDYDLLIQLCDKLALPSGFCILEKRFVDVALRYGTFPVTVPRWKKVLEIKDYFEEKIGHSIYDVLPGVVENTFK